jgi:hypothetical protein
MKKMLSIYNLAAWLFHLLVRSSEQIIFAFLFSDLLNNGYTLDDPVYLKAGGPGAPLGGNDIRITPVTVFSAGSRVSSADPDAGSLLTRFYQGPAAALTLPTSGSVLTGPPLGIGGAGLIDTAIISFFNANGNTRLGQPVYDEGDVVYFDVAPLNVVFPNDIRLY